MTEQHTPGPWFSDIDGFAVPYIGAFGFDTYDGSARIANLSRSNSGPITYETAKANARLIAAAPGLLELLEDMTNLYVELVNSGDCGIMDDAETEVEVLAARAEIRKAKGETE